MMDTSYSNHPIKMLPDEDRLVRQARSGDIDAFAQLYDSSVKQVYRYVSFRVENDRVAEAITLRTFIKAWEQIDHYRAFGPSFSTWLYSIAGNEIIAYYKNHKKTATQDSSFVFSVEGRYLGEEVLDMFDMQAMRDGLKFLPEEEQQILILRFIVGLPIKNIARIMSRRDSQVRVLQIRALDRLSSYMKEKELI